MKKSEEMENEADMLDEYDFSGAVRGKYARRFAEGSNLILLAPDVAEIFTDSESVNEALRTLVKIAKQSASKKE